MAAACAVAEQVRSILPNAGSSGGANRLEHNVEMDVAAYAGLWRGALPIDWYPCSSSTVERHIPAAMDEHNTWRYASHGGLFRTIASLAAAAGRVLAISRYWLSGSVVAAAQTRARLGP